MTQIYRHDFIVPEEALDENKHVNNLVYLSWFIDAAQMHVESMGITDVTHAVRATWIVRSHHIEYLRPAFAGEHMSIWTWVSNIRRVQTLRKYKIFRLEDEALLAEGETNWIFMDAQNGKMRSIPKEVQDMFEILPVEQEKDFIKLTKSIP